MTVNFKTFLSLIKSTYKRWDNIDPFAKSAIIAYYTLFSLPSLLMIVVTIAGKFFGRDAVQGRITSEIGGLIGDGAAEAIEGMIANAALNDSSAFTVVFGVGALLFGATGAFFQLKRTMNFIWNVKEKDQTILRMVIDRVISFGMILVVGLMLLVSLVISATIGAISEYVEQIAPNITAIALDIGNFLFSYIFITALFASIFKILPDVKLKWRVTLLGASVTTLLFLIGEYLLGFYFGHSEPASVYGGASSVVLILLWVYYTCLIVFFGACFTVEYALYKNEKVEPNEQGESALEQELQELELKKKQAEEDHKDFKKLENGVDM